jgi:hypothetical protein
LKELLTGTASAISVPFRSVYRQQAVGDLLLTRDSGSINSTFNRACNSRVDTLSEEMLVEMKKAGCWLIAFGVELGDPEMLATHAKAGEIRNSNRRFNCAAMVGIRSSGLFPDRSALEGRENL